MRSRTTARFGKLLDNLPDVRRAARRAYAQFLLDPWHRSLQFKQVHPTEHVYSARIGSGYRAVGRRDESGIVWFWIGARDDYERVIAGD